MLIDLSRFRGGLEHLERTYDPEAFTRDADAFRVVAPVSVVAELRKDSQKVRLVGRVTTTLELDCSRCLEPFTVPIDAKFDVLFLPAGANVGEGEQEVGDEDSACRSTRTTRSTSAKSCASSSISRCR